MRIILFLASVFVYSICNSSEISDRLINVLEFDAEPNSESLISFSVLFSQEEKRSLHALVEYSVYSNGGCFERGVCGCGEDIYYASVVINEADTKVRLERVLVSSCHNDLDYEVLNNKKITTLLVKDMRKFCLSATPEKELSIFAYDESRAELGLHGLTGGDYLKVTGKSPILESSGASILDECFYHKYDVYRDYEWRGANSREMVFKKIIDKKGMAQVGKFVAYKINSDIIMMDNPDVRPQRPRKAISRLKKEANGNTLDIALLSFKNQDYKKAEDIYYDYIQSNLSLVRTEKISLINDLAITQYKLKKYDESISWSKQVLLYKNHKSYTRLAASANYNLGLAYEARFEIKQAKVFYEKSYSLRKTKSAKQAIDRLN